ncbi:hypothetical protein CYMTET_32138 [Cymbomonas tetramitiformis]|uniref:C3H1-type domain-containing protein n=1 Tax=Cymbomonas tetramitiformis TaxID=36881 RepID=A0AAE0FFD7_9CHLO|nr:hypothetical protein CYMTET_32138 [Cymbomonas tetramitiformis]
MELNRRTTPDSIRREFHFRTAHQGMADMIGPAARPNEDDVAIGPAPRPAESESAGAPAAERLKGKVAKYNVDKGFGFLKILPAAGDPDVFVHHRNIKVEEGSFRSLEYGEEVEFEVSSASGRPEAYNVTAPGGKCLKGQEKKKVEIDPGVCRMFRRGQCTRGVLCKFKHTTAAEDGVGKAAKEKTTARFEPYKGFVPRAALMKPRQFTFNQRKVGNSRPLPVPGLGARNTRLTGERFVA